jgi:hybrid cluster-associated redox disulfide protein
MTPESRVGERVTADTIVADAMRMHPKARWVFEAWHLGACSGCGSATTETMEELAECYGLPLEKLLADLNGLFPS